VEATKKLQINFKRFLDFLFLAVVLVVFFFVLLLFSSYCDLAQEAGLGAEQNLAV
jgi:lipopolysaccharide/colanic/teichoic acid biosynthesis glycosyltransferase